MQVSKRTVRLYIAVAVAALCAAAQTNSGPANQERFFGRWKFDRAASKVADEASIRTVEWRSYAADGEGVRVSWGKGTDQLGSYSARCDGSTEPSDRGNIRCRQTDTNTIEGEIPDGGDKLHRYYRRAVSADGRTMTITWYTDAARRRPMDRFVYVKETL
jgi:hypothetical protein